MNRRAHCKRYFIRVLIFAVLAIAANAGTILAPREMAPLCVFQKRYDFALSAAAFADRLPPELIPPDVTLTPNASTSAAAAGSAAAPGVTTGASAMPATGATPTAGSPYTPPGTPIKAPQPPPGGSTMFSGFPNAPGAAQRWPSPGMNSGGAPATTGGAAANQQADPVVVIDTNKGQITVRLFQQYAPKTVAAFLDMVNRGFYNGLIWHRVEPGFVIQTGCPYGNGTGLYIDPQTGQPRMLQLESSPNVKHNMAGVVAMAHFPKNPDSASSQFYITLTPQPSLDFKYTIFGGVIKGLEVLPRIQKGDKVNSITVQQ